MLHLVLLWRTEQFYLHVNIVFFTILRLYEAVTEETEEGLLIIGDCLVQPGSVLCLEAAAETVEEEAHRETASPDDLLQYRDCGLVRDHHYTRQGNSLSSSLPTSP